MKFVKFKQRYIMIKRLFRKYIAAIIIFLRGIIVNTGTHIINYS